MNRPSQSIMEHVTSPRNAGGMDDATVVGRSSNEGHPPRTTMYLKVADGRVERAAFQTFGCGYSIAVCSRLTELVAGMTIEQCDQVRAKTLIDEFDGFPRHKEYCADIAIAALQDAVDTLLDSASDNQPNGVNEVNS